MSKYIFDIEANGLLNTISHLWMVVFKKLGTDEFTVFTDDDPSYPSLSDMPEWIEENVTTLIAHNGVRYDIPALKKVLGYVVPSYIKVVDTLIVSRMNNWPNKRLNRKHSLAAWGEFLKQPKTDFNEFNEYSTDML